MSFSLPGRVALDDPAGTYEQVNYEHVPASDYAVVATANIRSESGSFGGDSVADLQFDDGGGAVVVYCDAQDGGDVLDSQVMFIRTAGYF